MSELFVVVAEDRQAFELATDLCDRIIAERSSWLRDHWGEEASRRHHRIWTGLEPSDRSWSSRSDVKRLAQQCSVRIQGLGVKAEGALARKALEVARRLRPGAAALFIVHDTDGDLETAARMREGAGAAAAVSPRVVIAAPHPEAEAWLMAGIVPETPEEREALGAERERLGFDPTANPGALSSGRAEGKRDAKRICEAILGAREDSAERWERCWKETPLEILERNGEGAGLREYTREVEELILPLLGDRAIR
ncbi:MAG: hypothetical protein IT372_35045 [Polyangiaceae bacterium]|nr:hypothetical protein [Polyangiaceae bacterium]